MKQNHKIAAFLSVLLAFSPVTTVKAEETIGFQVTIYGGPNGQISEDSVSVDDKGGNLTPQISKEGKCVKITDLEYGDVIIFNNASVTITGKKDYYVKGLKPGGRDNSYATTIRDQSGKSNIRTAIEVKMDSNYVVAYGVRGNEVGYEIRYVDEYLQPLAPSEKHMGTIGDYNIINYKYIEGYQPQGYNYGMTLSSDESQNIYTIIYHKATTTTIMDLTASYSADTTASANPNAQNDTEEAQELKTKTTAETLTEQASEKNENTDKNTSDIIDLDEAETPVAKASPKQDSKANNSAIYVGIGAIGALILAYLATHKKKIGKN